MMERLTVWFRCARCGAEQAWNAGYGTGLPAAVAEARAMVARWGWVRAADGWRCPDCAAARARSGEEE